MFGNNHFLCVLCDFYGIYDEIETIFRNIAVIAIYSQTLSTRKPVFSANSLMFCAVLRLESFHSLWFLWRRIGISFWSDGLGQPSHLCFFPFNSASNLHLTGFMW